MPSPHLRLPAVPPAHAPRARWRRRLAPIALVAAALSQGGCYLYRRPEWPTPQLTAAQLARADAQADLDTLVAIVREVHPDPSPRLGAVRDSLVQAWPDVVSRDRLWVDLNVLLATQGDGHTSLWLDTDALAAHLAAGGRTWPFAVQRTADGIVIRAVAGADSTQLRPGERVEAIAGEPVESLVARLGRAVPAELPTFRDRAVLGTLGPRLWRDGRLPPAEVTVRGSDGATRTVTVAGATRADLAAMRRPPAIPLTARRTADSVLVLDFAAMDGDLAAFTARLDSAFDAARVEGVRAVVVDVRRNGGGDSQWGDRLLGYVTSQPISAGLRKEWKGSTRYRAYFAKGVTPLLRHWLPFSWVDGSMGGLFSGPEGAIATMPLTPTPPPATPRRLERPLCVLVGPATFSSAMLFANAVRQGGLGTLIGEPTGEPPNSAGEVMPFRLERSGLAGQVSSARFVLDADTAAFHRGVQPHVLVAPTRDDVAAGRDPAMARALACGRAPR